MFKNFYLIVALEPVVFQSARSVLPRRLGQRNLMACVHPQRLSNDESERNQLSL
jgi:hypothetical protein